MIVKDLLRRMEYQTLRDHRNPLRNSAPAMITSVREALSSGLGSGFCWLDCALPECLGW
jgi:hypothetical protein